MIQCNYLDENGYTASATNAASGSITFSSVRDYAMEEFNVNTYSIKYVLQGTEHYFIGKQKFSVSAGKFLLVNRHQPLDIFVRSRKAVTGLCIHLRENLLKEVYAQLFFEEAMLLGNPLETCCIPPLENMLYNLDENKLGYYLQQITTLFNFSTNSIDIEQKELYYQLAKYLLETQNKLPNSTGGLKTVKHSTKQELLRRLELAKKILDAGMDEPLHIDALAQQCALSGSHLFRSFRKVYGVSPYHYLLQQKIKRAGELLRTKKASVAEAALLCGFSDPASFSKAFKKINGQSPMGFVQAGS